MNKVSRKISEITREEWIFYNWVAIQEQRDQEPVYFRASQRSIEKSLDAGRQWDEWRAAYNALHNTKDDNA
jgi:hypothetical protein